MAPGEQARYLALLSLRATLSLPCRLPPLPPPPRFVPSISPSITHPPSTRRAPTSLTRPGRTPRRASAKGTCRRARSRLVTYPPRIHYATRQTTTRSARIYWCANKGPQAGTIFLSIFVLYVFFVSFAFLLSPIFCPRHICTVLI